MDGGEQRESEWHSLPVVHIHRQNSSGAGRQDMRSPVAGRRDFDNERERALEAVRAVSGQPSQQVGECACFFAPIFIFQEYKLVVFRLQSSVLVIVALFLSLRHGGIQD